MSESLFKTLNNISDESVQIAFETVFFSESPNKEFGDDILNNEIFQKHLFFGWTSLKGLSNVINLPNTILEMSKMYSPELWEELNTQILNERGVSLFEGLGNLYGATNINNREMAIQMSVNNSRYIGAGISVMVIAASQGIQYKEALGEIHSNFDLRYLLESLSFACHRIVLDFGAKANSPEEVLERLKILTEPVDGKTLIEDIFGQTGSFHGPDFNEPKDRCKGIKLFGQMMRAYNALLNDPLYIQRFMSVALPQEDLEAGMGS